MSKMGGSFLLGQPEAGGVQRAVVLRPERRPAAIRPLAGEQPSDDRRSGRLICQDNPQPGLFDSIALASDKLNSSLRVHCYGNPISQ